MDKRKKTNSALQKRLIYEKMVSDISRCAVEIPVCNKFLEKTLEILAVVVDVSRIYLFEYDYSDNTMSNTFEWVAPGIESQKNNLQHIPTSGLTWWMSHMFDGRVISYHDVDDIPSLTEREILKSQQIRSILVVPFFVQGRFYGFMGFDECRQIREWSSENINILSIVVNIISSAIERRRAEELMRSSEEKYRYLFENIQDVYYEVNFEGVILEISPSVKLVSGYTREELIGKRLDGIYYYPEKRDEFLQEISGKGHVMDYEVTLKDKDGSPVYVSLTSKLINRVQNSRPHIIGSLRDISERKKTENELIEHRINLERLVEERTSEVQKTNQQLQKEIREREIVKNALRLEKDQVRRMNEELIRANSELKSLDEMKNNFLSNVTHELKTPLVAMKGFASMLYSGRSGELSCDQREHVEIILRNTDRLVTLIDSLIDFSAITSGREKYEFVHFDLLDIAKESVSLVRSKFGVMEKEIIFVEDYQVSSLEVQADPYKIQQVFINLIDNAAKFSPQKGRIWISVRRPDREKAEVQVRDEGIGIPEEHIDKVFGNFYQVDSSSTRRHKGMGIGLPICRGIIQRHGGQIHAQSEAGNGTTFTFTVPLKHNL
ncbi:MAG: ATP-binding protein [Candidatus Wallbacteria bacterium]|nr:ATP-binding protein [Candidatus Wallbacteria bacterium]